MVHEFEFKLVLRASEADKDSLSAAIKECFSGSSDITVENIIPTKIDNYYEFPSTWVHLYRLENPETITSAEQIPKDAHSFCSLLFERSDKFLARMEEHRKENYNLVKITHYMGYGYEDVLYLGQYEPDACLQKVLEYYELDF